MMLYGREWRLAAMPGRRDQGRDEFVVVWRHGHDLAWAAA